MFNTVLLFSIVGVSYAIVCTPELCQNMKQEPLNCRGSIIPNGGFCRCTDACAKVEGESCQATFMFGMIPAGSCDTGLVCKHPEHTIFGRGICTKPNQETTKTVSSRMLSSSHHTACEQQRMARLISQVVWRGMWIPKCNPLDGSFLPQQCDNINQCFCVDTMSGKVDESTKMLGHVDCTSQTASDVPVAKIAHGVDARQVQSSFETTHSITKCQKMRSQRMTSLVMWNGWWMPNCDFAGRFLPEQCDNNHDCFCVDTMTGDVDESTKMFGHVDCTTHAKTAVEAPVSNNVREVDARELQSMVDTTTHQQTACEKMRAIRMISFVIWRGMWTPKCDQDGNFLPEQCDNTKKCFCVDMITGVVDESTKMLGHVDCSSHTHTVNKVPVSNNVREVDERELPSSLDTESHQQTKCEQIRAVRMISFVIWQGMWTPKCDINGKFLPEQCDNTGHCFCVSADEGTVDESTKVLGSANCISKTPTF